MSDSTSIDSLPMPTGNDPKVKLEVNEKNVSQSSSSNDKTAANVPLVPKDIDPNAMNKVMSGIQQAQMQGMTQLPSRDIPMTTNQIVQDKQTQPNYVPNEEKGDYIKEEDTYEALLQKKKDKMEQEDRLDMLYNEMQMPLLIMVLFFIFQMPITQKKFFQFFPSMFKKDGNMSMGGYLLKTGIFGLSFYGIMKLSKYASEL
jgi:hypothetical protein